MNSQQWDRLSNHVRSKIASLYDPAQMFVEQQDLKASLVVPHIGFYIGVLDSGGNEIIREGFMKEGLGNAVDSVNVVIKNLFDGLQDRSVDHSRTSTSSFNFTMITACDVLKHKMAWDESRDGVYFQWGQRYRGLYLPYQIKNMNSSKLEIMDKLCSWEAGVASNLWRLPEGLVFKLTCEIHTS